MGAIPTKYINSQGNDIFGKTIKGTESTQKLLQ